MSRVEGFSDAVFAFAITLLVVSLEVPKTFEELMAAIRAFPAFAVCFALPFRSGGGTTGSSAATIWKTVP